MFVHVFKYRLKLLLRDRTLIFWALLFPLTLAILFKVAFGGLGANERFNAIAVAVVDTPAYQEDESFRTVLESVSTGEDPLFNLQVVTLEEAQTLLESGKIRGYIVDDQPGVTWSLVVKSSGLNQSIIKVFLDQYSQSARAVGTVMQQPQVDVARVLAVATERETFTKEVSTTAGKMDMTLNYFYGLMGMACMYGAFYGTQEVNLIQANISQRAARINLVPVHKMKLFVYGGAASLLIQFTQMLLLLAFIVGVLGIDFGDRIGWIVLTLFMGSFVGVFFGAFVSSLVVSSESVKLAITLTVSMFGSMLAGMMIADVKYVVMMHAPILLYINPVNLISDAFYSLYYFTDMTRYFTNLGLIGVFAVLFAVGTYLVIRGRKYASL